MEDLAVFSNMLTIQEEKGIARAARKLYMTQSALNQQLLRVEKEVGAPLFRREYHEMIPTYAGKIYLDMARTIIEERNKAYKRIQDVEHNAAGEISIAYSPEKGAQAFAEVYPVFHEYYPGYTFKTMEATSVEMEDILQHHKATYAFMLYSELAPLNPEFDHFDQSSEYMMLVLNKKHPLAELAGKESWKTLPTIEIRLLRDDTFIFPSNRTLARRHIDKLFRDNGIVPKILIESTNNTAALKMVCRNMGPAFLPESYIDPSLPVVYFRTSPAITWVHTAAYLKGTYISKPERDFLNMMRNQERFNHIDHP